MPFTYTVAMEELSGRDWLVGLGTLFGLGIVGMFLIGANLEEAMSFGLLLLGYVLVPVLTVMLICGIPYLLFIAIKKLLSR